MQNTTESQQQRERSHRPLFDLGRVVATASVNDQLAACHRGWMAGCLSKHCHGNWGQVDDHDHEANNASVANGSRILSVYPTPKGVKTDADTVWVITDAADDGAVRHTTTFLYPHEY